MSTKGYVKYSKEVLEEAVSNSKSVAGVLRYLGLKASGGNQTHMRNRIRAYGIDTSHFTGAGWNKGGVSPNRKTPEEILVRLPNGSGRPKRPQLKRAMMESGLKYICSECNQGPDWNGKELCIEIDHIDGDWYNNLLDNLRFLCPNCHSQTPTSRSWRAKSEN